MSIKMWAYKNGSQGAKDLAAALGIRLLKKQGSKWAPKANDAIINWGCIEPFPKQGGVYVNMPHQVHMATNKLKTQRAFEGKDFCIPFTTSRVEAENWIKQGSTVVCRQKLAGHSGEGIVIAESLEELVQAPMYTLYVKKTQEYRIHVFNGEIIDVQRKARKGDVPDEEVNWKVRNLDGGFIFARNGVVAPAEVLRASVDAIDALGLNNGAVDVGYHKKEGTFVYEVNTACGLAGSTLHTYAKAYAKLLNIPEHRLNLPEIEGGYIPMAEQPDF